MKSIYNYPLVKSQPTTALTNISNLLDVQIIGAQQNDQLVFDNAKWRNKPQILDSNQDVQLNTPANGESLVYNGTSWVNKELILNDLGDVVVSTPSIGQSLIFDGDYWTNQQLPTNNLSTLNDVQLNTPVTNDILKYNGTKWVNKKLIGSYDESIILSVQTATASLRKVYTLNNAILNVSLATVFQDEGESILIISNGSTSNEVNAQGLSFFYNDQAYANMQLTITGYGVLQLVNNYSGGFNVVILQGRWYGSIINKYLTETFLQDLRNVTLLAPSNGQSLVFNSGTWSNQNAVNSFNSRTGTILPSNGDYNISQITNASVLANSTNISISGPVNGQYLTYNGTQWINTNLPSEQKFISTAGNLNKNQYIIDSFQSGTYAFACYGTSRVITLTKINILLSIAVNNTGSRTFTIFRNGIATANTLTFTNVSGAVLSLTMSVPLSNIDTWAIFHTSAGGPPNSSAIITVEYI